MMCIQVLVPPAEAARQLVVKARARRGELAGKLEVLGPRAVLSRGYAIAQRQGGQVVRGADEVEVDEVLTLQLSSGVLEVRIIGKRRT